MAKKVKTEDSVLITAAKSVGAAAGKIAALVGTDAPASKGNAPKAGRIPKQNKSRLPRREKKALKAKASSVA